jgi:membrane associated rhomboid family serine protease
MGMTWHDGGNLEALRITARPEEDGTAVSVVLDRRGTLGVVAMFSGITMFLAVLFAAFALYPEAPALGYGGFIAGIGGALAVARGYWASSTRKVRERISVVMDAIDQTVTQPETQDSGLRTVGDGAGAPEADASVGADPELTGA